MSSPMQPTLSTTNRSRITMPRTSTAAVVQIAQHKPYAPPMAHKVHITAPYLPACATDVRRPMWAWRASSWITVFPVGYQSR